VLAFIFNTSNTLREIKIEFDIGVFVTLHLHLFIYYRSRIHLWRDNFLEANWKRWPTAQNNKWGQYDSSV